jgi:hypothetical protein
VVSPSDGSRTHMRCPRSVNSNRQRHHEVEVSAQAGVRERAGPRRPLDDFSREESPAVAPSCLRSIQVVSSFARGAVRESLEAVRVAVWRRGRWRLIATEKMISS